MQCNSSIKRKSDRIFISADYETDTQSRSLVIYDTLYCRGVSTDQISVTITTFDKLYRNEQWRCDKCRRSTTISARNASYPSHITWMRSH